MRNKIISTLLPLSLSAISDQSYAMEIPASLNIKNLSNMDYLDEQLSPESARLSWERNPQNLLKHIRDHKTPPFLDLSNCFIDDVGAAQIVKVLELNTNILSIDLRGNNISNEGGKYFLSLLNINSYLRFVNLEGQWQLPKEVDGKFVILPPISNDIIKAINDALAKNAARTVDLWNALKKDYHNQLNRINSKKTTATHLYNLGGSGWLVKDFWNPDCQFRKNGNSCAIMMKLLNEESRENRRFDALVLNDHDIGDGGAIAIAEGLRNNNTLKCLSMTNGDSGEYYTNNDGAISDVGAIALARALKTNSTLELLRISGNNQYSNDVVIEFLELLKTNKTLCYLDIFAYYVSLPPHINVDLVRELKEALKCNRELPSAEEAAAKQERERIASQEEAAVRQERERIAAQEQAAVSHQLIIDAKRHVFALSSVIGFVVLIVWLFG